MSFPGRNSRRSSSSGDADSAGGGLLGRMQSGAPSGGRFGKFSASAPERSTMAALLIGAIAGMVIAYLVLPADFTGASPRHMSQSAIEQWVRMIAVGHAENLHYDQANALLALQQIPTPQDVVNRLAGSADVPAAERAAIASLKEIAGFGGLTGAAAPVDPGVIGSSLQVIIALAAVAIGGPVLVIAWRTIMPGASSSADALESQDNVSMAHAAPATRAPERDDAFASPGSAWQEEETEKSGGSHPQYGAPVMHAVSTYVKGQNYDDSFAIELGPEAGGQFLGECGISAATMVGNELQSVEFWGFDMASQETQTKVFAAPAAVSDPAMIAALGDRLRDPASDIISAALGATLVIDANAIQLQAQVRSVVCNYGGGSPDSGIESLQIEIAVWQKEGLGAGAPSASAGDNPFGNYANVGMASTGAGQSPPPPPPAFGQPGSAEQAKPPEDEEEDPFGGTGNFMPYN